jgi:hypothetical protein
MIGILITVKRLVKPPANGRNPEGIPARRMTEGGRADLIAAFKPPTLPRDPNPTVGSDRFAVG